MKKRFFAVALALLLSSVGTAAFAANPNEPTNYGTTDGSAVPQYTPLTDATDPTGAVNDGSDLQPGGSGLNQGIPNANQTGQGTDADSLIKAVTGADGTKHKTHGSYQNNTNSCASCHQTHTAKSKNLLTFAGGPYSTCTACHDGTLGFYNVFQGSSAGTFGGTTMGNASVHLATGAVKIQAAPGGNLAGSADGGTWTAEFSCASCHAPHGSYSSRLLHYNPNNMGNTAEKAANGKKLGQKVSEVPVVDTLPAVATDSPDWVLFRTTGQTIDPTLPADSVAIALYKKGASAYALDSASGKATPWLYGYAFGSPKNFWTRLYTTNTTGTGVGARLEKVDGQYPQTIDSSDSTVTFKYGKGYVYASSTEGKTLLASAVTGEVARAYVVKFTEIAADPADLTPENQLKVKYGVTTIDTKSYEAAGKGVLISNYCAACHVDYMNKSGSATGTYNETAFRHSTNSDRFNCLKCHYAHGTDVTVMQDASNNTVTSLVAGGMAEADAVAYLKDANPSSALKRYTNMSVCWKCHTDSKAGSLKNNDSYWNNYGSGPTKTW